MVLSHSQERGAQVSPLALSPHILRELWSKLAFIGPFGAVNAITGLKAAQLCSQAQCSRFLHGLVSEYVAVGNAEGAALPADAIERAMERLRGFGGISSMLRDRVGGRRLESDALVGSVVRRGAAHGVQTPLAESLDCLLSPMRDGGATSLG